MTVISTINLFLLSAVLINILLTMAGLDTWPDPEDLKSKNIKRRLIGISCAGLIAGLPAYLAFQIVIILYCSIGQKVWLVSNAGVPAAISLKDIERQTTLKVLEDSHRKASGGEGGIRTPDRLAPMPHFECGAIDHSATSPGAMTGRFGPWSGGVLGEDGWADKARAGRKSGPGEAVPSSWPGVCPRPDRG
jgi:hypothetical protein